MRPWFGCWVLIGCGLLTGCSDLTLPFGRGANTKAAYTILCLDAADPGHVNNAEALADLLKGVRGLDPEAVRVEHEADVSRIYYGRYRQRWDRRSGAAEPDPAARRDLERIRQLSLGGGATYPFLMARVVPVPRPSTVPEEWELSHCPGVYALQIGVFYDTPPEFTQRHQAAEEAVKLLRQRGYTAWYHHGDARSTIFVGSFDESAVIIDADGRQTYSRPVLDLQQAEEDFRYNTHNGRIVYRNVAGRRIPEGSVLIRVPDRGWLDG